MENNDPLMTTAEVAEYLRLSVDTIRARLKQDRFPKPLKLGSHKQAPNRWRRSTVDAWLERDAREEG